LAQIIIHRGTHTIGGSCIEINSNNNRILFDLGTPLMEKNGAELNQNAMARPSVKNGILPTVKGLYKDENPGILAVFISHAHIDHCGLLDHIHPEIPVFISEGTNSLIKIGRVFYPSQSKIFFDNYKIFKHWHPVKLGPFKITSYLMDHSGYDASSFLVEVDNKKIFYSGDFRGHGRKSKLLERIIEKPISNIDCLLMEGTTLGGQHKLGFENEEEVEQEFFNIFSKQKDVSLIMVAGSNVDRLVSLYKATRKSKKILVLDLYTYYLLDQLKQLTPSLPPFDGDNIRIFYIRGHAENIVEHLDKSILYKYKTRKIEIDEIVDRREQMVLKLPVSALKKISKILIKKNPFENVKYIFSMWKGYLDKDSYHQDYCNEYNAELVQVHVSGHAYLNDLKRFTRALKPKKLVPIHTLSGNDFESHFENVTLYDDSTPFEV